MQSRWGRPGTSARTRESQSEGNEKNTAQNKAKPTEEGLGLVHGTKGSWSEDEGNPAKM